MGNFYPKITYICNQIVLYISVIYKKKKLILQKQVCLLCLLLYDDNYYCS